MRFKLHRETWRDLPWGILTWACTNTLLLTCLFRKFKGVIGTCLCQNTRRVSLSRSPCAIERKKTLERKKRLPGEHDQ
jgi:hypothetical protein